MDVLRDGEIYLFGTVGDDFFMDGFSAMDVIDALARVGRSEDVIVHINSGGGYADEGVAIFNAFKAHAGDVTMIVEAMAASAASLIAMAGDTVLMKTGANMMIHDPSVLTAGTSADHQKSIEYLEARAAGMADIYAEKSGKTPEEARADMKEELWLTAEEAVEQGYADEVEDETAGEAVAFDYRLYGKAPERLKALAAAKGWKFKARAKAAPSAKPVNKENTMTTKTPAVATADDDKSGGVIASLIAGFTNAIASLAGGKGLPAAEQPATAPTPSPATAAALSPNDMAEIVTLANAASAPAMAAALIKEPGMSLEKAKARIDGAKAIHAAVADARKLCPAIDAKQAEAYIAAGASLEHTRADLLQKAIAAQSPEIASQHQAPVGKSAAAGWDRAVGKVNARFGGKAA